MNFDVYYPFRGKDGNLQPGIKPTTMDWNSIKMYILMNEEVRDKVDRVRQGEKDLKRELPAICYVGKCNGTRRDSNMTPTQLVMVDIDHCEKPIEAWGEIKEILKEKLTPEWFVNNIVLAHVTPSGKGLRIVFKAQADKKTLIENMKYLDDVANFSRFGDFDTATKDFARLSFLVGYSDLLYESAELYYNTEIKLPGQLVNDGKTDSGHERKEVKEDNSKVPPFTDEEKEQFDGMEYRGIPVMRIVEKYTEVNGTPSSGEIHNYYNEMVKNFRCITSNNKRCLLYLLPRFGHTAEECWSQIVSICRVNTLSTLPKSFYFFLKDNGFYKSGDSPQAGALKQYMLSETPHSQQLPPYLPPVFRELVGLAPADFIIPSINALLPIIGTLTSYAQAEYPYDNAMHTTSFFSIIYAPPGTGKGFVTRFLDMLFADLRLRDLVQSERENIYLRTINRKGANEKSPEQPHTSLRLIPPKNSEAEFLQKQKDNNGYHMFTYAAEMDSWAKGVKAAGGNKDDMIRIAWDNGEYGQQFKSASTFKGTVRLYWNVLITGTLAQVEKYFSNVENGLVTRCSFSSIDNQEFALVSRWKKPSKKALLTLKTFTQRCDNNTYTTPCTIDPDLLTGLTDEEFDKEVDWRFQFRPRKTFDCTWIMPTIDAFHKEQMRLATLDIDHARDVFRRRVGVRGFRLAIMCMCLWESPTSKQLEKCKAFINWWMHVDIENMLRLWGSRYNEQADVAPRLTQRSVFEKLPDSFETSDVYAICTKQGIKTPIRNIVWSWKNLGMIEKTGKGQYIKKKKQ